MSAIPQALQGLATSAAAAPAGPVSDLLSAIAPALTALAIPVGATSIGSSATSISAGLTGVWTNFRGFSINADRDFASGRGPFTGYGPGAANLPNWFLNGQGSVAAPSDAVPDTASAGRGLGQANTVGRLSVPSAWTVAAPEIRPAAFTLPITSPAGAPEVGGAGNLFSSMGLAGAAGGAVGSSASVGRGGEQRVRTPSGKSPKPTAAAAERGGDRDRDRIAGARQQGAIIAREAGRLRPRDRRRGHRAQATLPGLRRRALRLTLGGAVVNPAGYGALLLCGPLAVIAAVWLADRVGVPYPVLLVAVGAALGWLPGVHVPQLSPDVVFYVFLPPLLYYAAYFIAPDDLRANARSIGLLSVGLVLVTTATVAGVLLGIAGVPLVVALVAGAVVAPTDAVAATSVFARLDVPERLVTIVEGEGLTNDGTALVLYTGAVGAAMVGAVRPGPLALTLLAAPAGGAALGLAVAWVAVKVRQRIDNPMLEITLSLVTPYLTYVLAEGAHLSGVLATVAAGVYVGSHLSRIFAPGARLQAFAFLDVLVFLLNAVLFTLVGMELWRSLRWVPGMAAGRVVAVISAVVVVVIASRLVWMLSGPATARLFGRATGEPVWRERVVVAWAGMRGGLSLAAALAIPLHLADGTPFPDRDLVIVVAAAVIVTSLLIQGTSLPWLLRRLGLRAEDFGTEENKARLKAARTALEWLDDQSHADAADEATKSVRSLYEAKVRRLELGPPSDEESDDAQEMERYRALRLKLLGVERSVLLALRSDGRINATLLRTIERDFDLEEARLSGS